MFKIDRHIVATGGYCTSCGKEMMPQAAVWVFRAHDLGNNSDFRNYWVCLECIHSLRNDMKMDVIINMGEYIDFSKIRPKKQDEKEPELREKLIEL